ncbi:unnamed protein product [Prorocentrum cordatum]|uniref:UBA domain-containing protein n=1 Tax=Prorocentrum cordatum TaxID=2364126 RepID=A0ABN9XGV0_9DINO|nr:unnamed protein product [Polarella glacialis]
MLLRNPTRIEFKPEDAQEYLRSRERTKRQGATGGSAGSAAALGSTPGVSLSPAPRLARGGAGRAPGASPRAEGQPASWAASAAPQQTSPASAAPTSAAVPPDPRGRPGPPPTGPPPGHADGAVASAVSADAVAQLAAMGFLPARARDALVATGGDIEAAADWLLT